MGWLLTHYRDGLLSSCFCLILDNSVGIQFAWDLVFQTSQPRILHSKISSLCQSITINISKQENRRSQVRKTIGSEVKWTGCSLIILISLKLFSFIICFAPVANLEFTNDGKWYLWIYASRGSFIFVGLRPDILILCHVLARGWGRWIRYFSEAKAEVKYRTSARIRGSKHDTRFEWPVLILIMTRHPFLPIESLTKQVPKILVYLRSPVPFDSAVTASASPPNFECTHLLLRSADWWRHNILFSIARTIWIFSECKLSTDNYVNY